MNPQRIKIWTAQ